MFIFFCIKDITKEADDEYHQNLDFEKNNKPFCKENEEIKNDLATTKRNYAKLLELNNGFHESSTDMTNQLDYTKDILNKK